MRILFIALLSMAALTASSQTYADPTLSAHDRAVSIVEQMTLEEKVPLLLFNSPAVPRLGIKQYNWWSEALHGVGRAGLATVFPQPIGLAATFDDRLVFDIFTAVSDEARAKNTKAKNEAPLQMYQGLTFWTPNVNLFRDPRWGRGHETYGEDPYLTSRMGVSVVRGLQGDNYQGTLYSGDNAPMYYKLHACAKHYAVHSGPEWSRHSININYLSQRDLWESYLPAFKALVKDGGVKEVMCAYNRFENEPCCGNNRLLNTILREAWDYQGIVLSDCWAVSDFHVKGRHEIDPDSRHAAARAVRTGTDLECGETYRDLVEAVRQGLVDEATIDRSLIRLMTARYELGEMDDDSEVEWAQIPYSVVDCKKHRALALDAARKSMVLLKNNGILPLSPDAKIAVLGPNANDSVMQWGNYNGFPSHTSTLWSAMQNRLGDDQLKYIPGLDHTSDYMIESLWDKTSASGTTGFDAKFFNNSYYKELTRTEPDATFHYSNPLNLTTQGATVWAPGVDLGNFVGVFTTTFTPDVTEDVVFALQTQGVVMIEIDGEMVFEGGNMKSANAYTLHAEKDRSYDIRVTYSGTEGNCCALTFDFGRSMPLDIASIISDLDGYDTVVFAGGLSPNLEGEEMPVAIPGFRGGDRETIELPSVQFQMLKALRDAGKKIVYVNYSGSAIALPEESEIVDALLQAWYPGQAGGEAVADVIFGNYNPAGRLPVTFYRSTDDLPDIEDYNMANRTYRFFKGEPLYPFGYGLSYSTFEYGQPTAERTETGYKVTVPVKNISNINGDEVVQIYVSNPTDENGPAKQLCDFGRIHLKANHRALLRFSLDENQLQWYDPAIEDMRPMPDNLIIWVGPNSRYLIQATMQ